MATNENDEQSTEIPETLCDEDEHKIYKRQGFLGKGAFAKCYEIVDVKTNDIFAGKIISKKLLMKQKQKERTMQEISIHCRLNHPNIVKFFGFFEDIHNMYVVLELCKNRSLMELQKHRKFITEYECRYYMYQIIQGVNYLHEQRIIHRDLKLHNIFLDESLHVKLGDFGLATYVESDGKLRMTLCGTPNYMAPEILTKKGHSFEVDIWSIGCIMYTLLVGQPPFQTQSVNDTYRKIKTCQYRVPTYLRKSAVNMIVAMLQLKPERRPKISALLKFEFLTTNTVPKWLPSSCLVSLPRSASFDVVQIDENKRKPLLEKNVVKDDTRLELTFLKQDLNDSLKAFAQISRLREDYRIDISNLHKQLTDLISSKPKLLPQDLGIESTDPAAKPLFWVTKWVDYSDKYGFGYELCDESIAVMFNDATTLITLPNQINIHYIDQDGKETYMTSTHYCKTLEKKMKLLEYFRNYMSKSLVKFEANNIQHESDEISRSPRLQSWFRTKCAVAMHLTNGSIQFNFTDHVKIILCPRMSAITYKDHKNNFRTYCFSTIAQHGCFKDIYTKICYAYENIGKMIDKMN